MDAPASTGLLGPLDGPRIGGAAPRQGVAPLRRPPAPPRCPGRARAAGAPVRSPARLLRGQRGSAGDLAVDQRRWPHRHLSVPALHGRLPEPLRPDALRGADRAAPRDTGPDRAVRGRRDDPRRRRRRVVPVPGRPRGLRPRARAARRAGARPGRRHRHPLEQPGGLGEELARGARPPAIRQRARRGAPSRGARPDAGARRSGGRSLPRLGPGLPGQSDGTGRKWDVGARDQVVSPIGGRPRPERVPASADAERRHPAVRLRRGPAEGPRLRRHLLRRGATGDAQARERDGRRRPDPEGHLVIRDTVYRRSVLKDP